MSAIPQRETYRCAYCDGERDAGDTYCSTDCGIRHRGQKALNHIRNDHRLCGSCARWLKEVETPSEDWLQFNTSKLEQALAHGGEYHNVDSQITLDVTECPTAPTKSGVIGFQYRTENAEPMHKSHLLDEEKPWSSIDYTGTGCRCGCAHPEITDEGLRDLELPVSLSNHYLAFEKLKREGKPVPDINREVLFSTFKESRDFELAFGRARE